ncbi:MAG: hypothetical protein LUE89_11235 [Clostridiales bacterium]|nr:hypothetical protein [Clostridiales bacterium]
MKTAKITKILKGSNHAEVFRAGYSDFAGDELAEEDVQRGNGAQWLSNGAASYQMDSMPLIRSVGQFCATFDVPEKKRESFFFRFSGLPEYLQFERWDPRLAGAVRLPVSLVTDDRRIELFSYVHPVNGQSRVMFIDALYLTPFDGMDNLTFCVMQDRLVVFDGVFTCAVIHPMDIRDDELSAALMQAQREIQQSCRERDFEITQRERKNREARGFAD